MFNSLKRINYLITIMIIVVFLYTGIIYFVESHMIKLFILFGFIIFLLLIKRNVTNSEIEIRKQFFNTSNILTKEAKEAIEYARFGIIVYDENYTITWHNITILKTFNDLIGKDIRTLFDNLFENMDFKTKEAKIDDEYYEISNSNRRVLIFHNMTEKIQLLRYIDEHNPCIGFVKIDNLEELVQTKDDLLSSTITSNVRKMINEWALENNFFVKKYQTDASIMMGNKMDLQLMINAKFDILEKVKAYGDENDVNISLSMGFAFGAKDLIEVEKLATNALDMALVRGGDQVVVKEEGKELRFFGGNSEATEKRNKVKVRIISETLSTLITESSNVMIMPHKTADLDALGAALGVVKLCNINRKPAYIVADVEKMEQASISAVKTIPVLMEQLFITEYEALDLIDDNTLLIIVDVNRPSLLESQVVYERVKRRIVIDHHRRAEDFIENPLLIYIESYASSTTELVTELLQYQNKAFKIDYAVATIMLSGIMLDTNNFKKKTGSRTFSSAAFLKEFGAESNKASEWLQLDLSQYQRRLEFINNARIVEKGIVIATQEKLTDRTIMAQAASEMLEIKGIKATFIVGKVGENKVAVSARSHDFNVQTIIEKIGGGGHFNMAAAQLENQSVEDIEDQLINIIRNQGEKTNESNTIN